MLDQLFIDKSESYDVFVIRMNEINNSDELITQASEDDSYIPSQGDKNVSSRSEWSKYIKKLESEYKLTESQKVRLLDLYNDSSLRFFINSNQCEYLG